MGVKDGLKGKEISLKTLPVYGIVALRCLLSWSLFRAERTSGFARLPDI